MENNNTNMFTQTNITITNGLPRRTGQVPTVLLGRTFLLQIGLPTQIELALHFYLVEHCSTLCLPGRTELALIVLLGRTFLLQMGLPIQTELAITALLGGTLLHIAFTWTNRTSTDSFTWTEISTTNRFTYTNRATTNRFTWWNIAPHCVYLDKQN